MFDTRHNPNRDHRCLGCSAERTAHQSVDSFHTRSARGEWSLDESVIRSQSSLSANAFSFIAFNWRL